MHNVHSESRSTYFQIMHVVHERFSFMKVNAFSFPYETANVWNVPKLLSPVKKYTKVAG